jgi:hypothetical protein
VALFNILVDIAAKTASFESGIDRVEQRLTRMSSSVASFAGKAAGILGIGVSFAAVAESIDSAVQRGDMLARVSERMKTSVEFLSQMQYVANQSDIAFESLTGSLDTFAKNLSQAGEGAGRGQQALHDLGIDAKALLALPLDKQLEVIADRMAEIPNATDKARIAMQLFGSADILTALQDGAAGIQRLRDESDRLGYTLSTQSAAKLAEVDENMKKLKATAQGLSNTLVTSLAPALTAVLAGFNDLLPGTKIEKSLSQQLSELATHRNELLALERNESSDGLLNRILFGSDEARRKALADTQKSIAFVEQQMNAINAQMLAADQAAQKGSAGGSQTSIAALTPRPFFNPQTELELKKSYEYVEGLEKDLQDRHREVEQNRKEVSQDSEEGIRDAIAETHQANMQNIDDTIKGFERIYEANDKMSVYAEQAARNMQDAFADFLFDPFKDGIKGMLKGFIDVIRRMVAEAAAAKIFETVFGKGDGSKSSGAGQFFSSALDAFFGGGKAKGGPLDQNKWYIAGEHGPEPIWGGGSGAFAAGYGGGGGLVVNNYVTLTGSHTVTKDDLARAMKQTSDQTVARVRDDKRRGVGAFNR